MYVHASMSHGFYSVSLQCHDAVEASCWAHLEVATTWQHPPSTHTTQHNTTWMTAVPIKELGGKKMPSSYHHHASSSARRSSGCSLPWWSWLRGLAHADGCWGTLPLPWWWQTGGHLHCHGDDGRSRACQPIRWRIDAKQERDVTRMTRMSLLSGRFSQSAS